MSYFLAIIGKEDKPLYELEFSSSRQSTDQQSQFPPTVKDLTQYIVHASLDVVDEVQWTTPNLYLKNVDKFYGFQISAFVTPGNVRLLLLHYPKNEDAIKQFFMEVWDIYVKTLLSPFYNEGDYIESAQFDLKVKALARKHL